MEWYYFASILATRLDEDEAPLFEQTPPVKKRPGCYYATALGENEAKDVTSSFYILYIPFGDNQGPVKTLVGPFSRTTSLNDHDQPYQHTVKTILFKNGGRMGCAGLSNCFIPVSWLTASMATASETLLSIFHPVPLH